MLKIFWACLPIRRAFPASLAGQAFRFKLFSLKMRKKVFHFNP